jgi:hypothetical protein
MGVQRAAQYNNLRYFGAPLALDLFPEGEVALRGLKAEYDRALTAWRAGDDQAYSKFFEQHPEYQARLDYFKSDDPETRLRNYLKSQVWDAWGKLNSAQRKAFEKEAGPIFSDNFLNKETRAYDTVKTETMAAWAQRMGATPPTAGKAVAPTTGTPLVDPAIQKLVDVYDQTRKDKFPNLSANEGIYYGLADQSFQQKMFGKQHPEIRQAQQYKSQYIAQHPELAPVLTSEESSLYGLPAQVQAGMYTFWAARDSLFPDYSDQQDAYYAISQPAGRSAYLKTNPELRQYWDWKRNYASKNPTLAPHIYPNGEPTGSSKSNEPYVPAFTISAQQKRVIVSHAKTNTPLSLGIESEVRQWMVAAKAPAGMTPDQFLQEEMGAYLEKALNPGHPAVLSRDEVMQIPPELVRIATAHKFLGEPWGAGAEAEAIALMKKFGITGVAVDKFLNEYVEPAIS